MLDSQNRVEEEKNEEKIIHVNQKKNTHTLRSYRSYPADLLLYMQTTMVRIMVNGICDMMIHA